MNSYSTIAFTTIILSQPNNFSADLCIRVVRSHYTSSSSSLMIHLDTDSAPQGEKTIFQKVGITIMYITGWSNCPASKITISTMNVLYLISALALIFPLTSAQTENYEEITGKPSPGEVLERLDQYLLCNHKQLGIKSVRVLSNPVPQYSKRD